MADALDTGDTSKGETLMDIEAKEQLKQRELRAQKLSKVAHEIEAILVREELTWGDWGEIVEMFSVRISNYIGRIKVNFFK